MIGVKAGANGEAFIAGRRLDISPAERRAVKDLSVGNAIQSTPTSHSDILRRNRRVQAVQQMKKHFFEAMLQREGQIHVALRDLGVRLSSIPKELLHPIGEVPRQTNSSIWKNLHALIASQRLEVAEIQAEAPVLHANKLINLLAECVPAIGSQAHDFAFVAIFRVADEFADHRVQAA